jgi:hypothetical protein
VLARVAADQGRPGEVPRRCRDEANHRRSNSVGAVAAIYACDTPWSLGGHRRGPGFMSPEGWQVAEATGQVRN